MLASWRLFAFCSPDDNIRLHEKFQGKIRSNVIDLGMQDTETSDPSGEIELSGKALRWDDHPTLWDICTVLFPVIYELVSNSSPLLNSTAVIPRWGASSLKKRR